MEIIESSNIGDDSIMNQYDINVSKVMDYLAEHNYGSSSRSLHKVCYERFKTYLVKTIGVIGATRDTSTV